MKRKIIAGLVAVMCAFATAASAGLSAQSVAGIWLVQSKDGKFEIEPCGDSLCGRLIWGNKPRPKDDKNKDPALRGRPIVGALMMEGYRLSKDGLRWVGGRIYNPEDGNYYRSILEPGPGDTLKVKGCLGPFCQIQTWTRSTP